jgi:DNA-binding response OmpR family regulator
MDGNKKKKLLIVEDDFYIRDLYTLHAKLMNFDFTTAVDGEDALEKIKSIKPDLVLLDLMLPKIDGLGVLRMIKADPTYAEVKFIITTNVDNQTTKEEAKRLGALDYLLKINNLPQATLTIAQTYLTS